jgi:hypothetical protein
MMTKRVVGARGLEVTRLLVAVAALGGAAGCEAGGVDGEATSTTVSALTVTLTVSGVVTSAQGPVAGAVITVTGSAQASAITDATGNYTLSLNPGSYQLTVGGVANCAFQPSVVNLNNLNANSVQSFTGTGSGCAVAAASRLSDTFFNHNFQDVPVAPFPGVTVARLTLGPGSYVMNVKFRYRGTGTTVSTAGCAFQGTGIGGLDASQANVPIGGENTGQVDAYMMDILTKNPGDDPDVHVQCFGPPDVHIINSQFAAVATTLHLQR